MVGLVVFVVFVGKSPVRRQFEATLVIQTVGADRILCCRIHICMGGVLMVGTFTTRLKFMFVMSKQKERGNPKGAKGMLAVAHIVVGVTALIFPGFDSVTIMVLFATATYVQLFDVDTVFS